MPMAEPDRALPHALIVVDVQEAMFGPVQQPPVHCPDETVDHIKTLLDKARAAGAKVIYIQHHDRKDPEMAPGRPGFAIRAAIAPEPDETVVVKRICDSFAETNLEQILRDAGVLRLVTCGIQSEFCVDAATRGAMNRGFEVVLASDAHTTWANGVLTAEQISAHINATLPEMSGVGPNVRVLPAAAIEFAPPGI
jgi:nicotinamidase-related amidase